MTHETNRITLKMADLLSATSYCWLLLFTILFKLIAIEAAIADDFSEELTIRTLPTGSVHSFFQFRTTLETPDKDAFTHYNLFPKSLGQIINKYNIHELHLSLSHGYWTTEKWGYPVTVAPPGAELWVWFSNDLEESSVDAKWTGLVNALSGQFCASLNFITKATSLSPKLSFKPHGLWPEDNENATKYIRYATLPRENVCTENLTPWIKLLPCQGKAGLSTLLNALVLYNTAYHSLGVHIRSICKDDNCFESSLELKQTLSTVHDEVTANIEQGWLFSRLFGKNLQSRCPMATVSKVLVDISGQKHLPIPTSTEFVTKIIQGSNFTYAVYDLTKFNFFNDFNMLFQQRSPKHQGKVQEPSIYAERHLVGYGGEFGGVVSTITNTDPLEDIKIVYLTYFPWFVRIYLHTLKVTVDGSPLRKEYFKYIPSKDRARPAMMEMVLTIPTKRNVVISVEYEKAFLRWTEHPPDSHHGFYIGSSVISVVLPNAANMSGFSERCSLLSRLTMCQDPDHLFARIYTKPLLVALPTPDFSMPYNVICLTCTILAIGFGGLFNAATKKLVVVSRKPKTLKDRIKGILSWILSFRIRKMKTE